MCRLLSFTSPFANNHLLSPSRILNGAWRMSRSEEFQIWQEELVVTYRGSLRMPSLKMTERHNSRAICP